MRRRLVGLALPALLLLGGCTVNPVTGKTQLDLMGESQELELGQSLYPQAIQGSLGPLGDAAAQAEVERVGRAVAAVSHRPNLPYRFTAVNEPEANAFALPGGKICVTRGLLARLHDEDGLAAVLGHEVGHVTARHAVAAYNRRVLATVILVGGAVYMEAEDTKNRGLIELGAVLGTELVLAHYSRDQERQSDELGIDYAVKAGYSPQGMVETQRVLLDLQRTRPGLVARLFASHPLSAERLAAAEKRVAQLPPEVRQRPLRPTPYLAAVADVVHAGPAWDLAGEGRELLGKDKGREAEAKLAEAARLAPGEGVIRTLHAVSLAALERHDPAAGEAREGARLSPDVYLSRFVAGKLLLESDPAAALENLDRAEEILPGQAELPLLRGQALERLGRRDDAVKAYQAAVERDPNGTVGSAAGKRLQALGAR